MTCFRRSANSATCVQRGEQRRVDIPPGQNPKRVNRVDSINAQEDRVGSGGTAVGSAHAGGEFHLVA